MNTMKYNPSDSALDFAIEHVYAGMGEDIIEAGWIREENTAQGIRGEIWFIQKATDEFAYWLGNYDDNYPEDPEERNGFDSIEELKESAFKRELPETVMTYEQAIRSCARRSYRADSLNDRRKMDRAIGFHNAIAYIFGVDDDKVWNDVTYEFHDVKAAKEPVYPDTEITYEQAVEKAIDLGHLEIALGHARQEQAKGYMYAIADLLGLDRDKVNDDCCKAYIEKYGYNN